MSGILKHWQQLQLNPDGIYLGYLGQGAADQWERWLPKFQSHLILIDPVMGDDGKRYKGFDSQYVATMQRLAQRATVLTPNVTEAQLLLEEPLTAPTDPKAVSALARRLYTQFNSAVLITGVPYHNQVAGDLFAAALASALLKGQTLRQAAAIGMIAAQIAIKATLATNTNPKYGLNLTGVISAISKELP